jgi:hypothetical protein
VVWRTHKEKCHDLSSDVRRRHCVPVGFGFGRLFLVGKLPVNMQRQSFYNVVHPDFAPTCSVRFQILSSCSQK